MWKMTEKSAVKVSWNPNDTRQGRSLRLLVMSKRRAQTPSRASPAPEFYDNGRSQGKSISVVAAAP